MTPLPPKRCGDSGGRNSWGEPCRRLPPQGKPFCDLHDPAVDRCDALSSDGDPCGRQRILGGRRCPLHSGSTQSAKSVAKQHLFEANFAALRFLREALEANDSRKAANKLVYYASAEQGEAAILAAHALRLLGYSALADRIQDRLLAVKIDRTAHGVFIKTPYNPSFISALKAKYVAQRWDGQNKVWTLPDTQEAFEHLDAVLRQVYAGQWAVGPNGPFKV